MPTNANAYNSRLTSEALEKQFRDTFKSQGGAELVDDLYASGVIVPVVDFTAAAEGVALRADLQRAWDFATGHNQISNATTTIINTTGFWQVDLNFVAGAAGAGAEVGQIYLTDGLANKIIWQYTRPSTAGSQADSVLENQFIVFIKAGDSVVARTSSANLYIDVWYRQIADISGNLTDPSGFTSS